jgi:hypothetical protein
MTVPYTFATATSAIPLSNLDSNFATAITIGSTAVYLGNTTTTIAGLTLSSPTLTTPALGTPSSGTLTNCTGYPGSAISGTISLTTQVTGTLPVANGGTGVTTSTGSGNVVLSTSPTLVTPILGTPTSGTLTNTTGFPAANLAGTALPAAIVTSSLTAVGTIATGVWNGTAIAIANGGTGQTTKAAAFNALSPITTTGDLIIGNGSNSATRLAIGANTYVLTSDGTTASWVAPSGGGSAATPTVLGTVYGKQSNANGIAAYGYQALNVNTAQSVSAFGNGAGVLNTTGLIDVFGAGAGGSNTTGSVAAFGNSVLYANTTGLGNSGFGTYDGTANPTLRFNTTGSYNSAFGAGALAANTTSSGSTAVGYQALYSNTQLGLVAFGYRALYSNTTGNWSVGVGYNAGYSNTTGTVIAIGHEAAYTNTTGSNIIAIGDSAAYTTNQAGNLGIIAIGNNVLYSNTTGTSNIGIGFNTSGGGQPPLKANTTGFMNVAIGAYALSTNVSGAHNVAIGESVLQSATSDYNTCVGSLAGSAFTTASSNTIVGAYAGYLLTTGGNNTFLGYLAGGWSGGTITTGIENIRIGYNNGGSSTGVNYSTYIGTSGVADKGSSTGYINPNSGGVYQGNNSATWSVSSDQRLKKNIVDNNVGLDKVIQIQVRNFEYRTEDEINDLPKNQAIKKEGVQLGVIAQELQQVLPDCVKQESTGVLAVDSTDIMYHMINAIKELNAKVIALETKLGV